MSPPPAPNVDLVLEDIRSFKGRGRLRPTKTRDKSKPILLAEGESLRSYIPPESEQIQETIINPAINRVEKTSPPPLAPPLIVAPPPPPPALIGAPPPPPPALIVAPPPPPPLLKQSNGYGSKPQSRSAVQLGKNNAVGFKKTSQGKGNNFNRDKLLEDIRGGVRLRRTVTDDRSQAPAGKVISNGSNNGFEHKNNGYHDENSNDHEAGSLAGPHTQHQKANRKPSYDDVQDELLIQLKSNSRPAPPLMNSISVPSSESHAFVQPSDVLLPPQPLFRTQSHGHTHEYLQADVPAFHAELDNLSNRELVAELRNQSEARFLSDHHVNLQTRGAALIQNKNQSGYNNSKNDMENFAVPSSKSIAARFEETITRSMKNNSNKSPKVVSVGHNRKAFSEEPRSPVIENERDNELDDYMNIRSFSLPPEEHNFREIQNGIVTQMLARLKQTEDEELHKAIEATDDNFGYYYESQRPIDDNVLSTAPPLPPLLINLDPPTKTKSSPCLQSPRHSPFRNSGILPSVSALKKSFENAQIYNQHSPPKRIMTMPERPRMTESNNGSLNYYTPATSESGFHEDDQSSLLSVEHSSVRQLSPVQSTYRPAYEELTVLPKVNMLKRNYEAKMQDKHHYTSSGGSISGADTSSSDGDQANSNGNRNHQHVSPFYNGAINYEQNENKPARGTAVISVRPASARPENVDGLSKAQAKAKINAVLALSVDGNTEKQKSAPITYHAQPMRKELINPSRLEYMPVDDIRTNFMFNIDPNSNQVLAIVPR